MGSKEVILRPRYPFDLGHSRIIDDAVLVDSGIFLGHGFVPDDITRRGSHDNIQMSRVFGQRIHVVT